MSFRILMFATGFAPYSFSECLVNSKLALAFKQHGWDIDIISMVNENLIYTTDWEKPWLTLKDSTYNIEYAHGTPLIRTMDLLFHFARMKYPMGGLRWSGRALSLAFKMHAQHPYHFVLSRSPQDISHVAALEFSRKTKIPWIANINDPPAHLWPDPYKRAKGFFRKAISKHLITNVFKYANYVTFPSARLCAHILKSFKSDDYFNKTRIIPHIGLVGYKSAIRKPDIFFRICHAGYLSPERNPKIFFEGIALFLKKANIDSLFEVRFIGVNNHELEDLSRKYGIDKFLNFSGGMSYFDTLSVFEQSDILVVVEAPCKEGIFLPSKVADYAQVSRPIFSASPENGTLADLIHETKCGEFASCNSPVAIANALMTLYESWRHKSLSQDYNSSALWSCFSPECIMKKYEDIFNSSL